ncbi:hypothetical protein B0H19DRAFT_1303676 [Mycena capillaripes]|nr:hypothetical protein B0H19DRAFT_1303676 [Mycena capillaripes]
MSEGSPDSAPLLSCSIVNLDKASANTVSDSDKFVIFPSSAIRTLLPAATGRSVVLRTKVRLLRSITNHYRKNQSLLMFLLDNNSRRLVAALHSCFSEFIQKQEEQTEWFLHEFIPWVTLHPAVEALRPQGPATDKKTAFWTTYMRLADEHDKEFQLKYSTDLDAALIFAGLFSAVSSAFIIQIQTQLTPDAPTIIVAVQGLLYTSLFTTLLAALLAVLGSRGTIEERGLERQRKLDASAEVPAVVWVLETSTDPTIVTAAAEVVVDLQWPLDLDLSTSMCRLDETFRHIVRARAPPRRNSTRYFPGSYWSRAIDTGSLTSSHITQLSNELEILCKSPSSIDSDDSAFAKWQLHTIPSLRLGGSIETRLAKILDRFDGQDPPNLDESTFVDYLCCIHACLGHVASQILAQVDNRPVIQYSARLSTRTYAVSGEFKFQLLTRLFKALKMVTVESSIAARVITTAAQLSNKSAEQRLQDLWEVGDLIDEISKFCSSLPPEQKSLQVLISAARLARIEHPGLVESPRVQSVGWIFTILEYGPGDIEEWDDAVAYELVPGAQLMAHPTRIFRVAAAWVYGSQISPVHIPLPNAGEQNCEHITVETGYACRSRDLDRCIHRWPRVQTEVEGVFVRHMFRLGSAVERPGQEIHGGQERGLDFTMVSRTLARQARIKHLPARQTITLSNSATSVIFNTESHPLRTHRLMVRPDILVLA